MKTIFLLIAILFLLAISVVAGDSKNSKTSIQGCLSGSAGNYMLTDQSGKSYQLEGETSKLGEHLGHEVELIGKASGTSSESVAASSSTSTGSSGTMSSESLKFNVSKVKKISDTCTSTKK
jgi:hypothetical protein